MGDRDYPRALENPLSKGKLIFEIANWTRDHRLTALKDVFERLLDHPPPGTRGVDLTVVSEALGVIGDETTARKLTARLEELTLRKIPDTEFLDTDHDLAMELIGALAALHYAQARSAVEKSFFYWFGVDSAFAEKPELLKIKKQLESELEGKAKKCLGDFGRVEAAAVIFLQNRTALVSGSETEPQYSFALEVAVRSQEHPELAAKSLQARLRKTLGSREGTIGVTRWDDGLGRSSGGNDARLAGRRDGLFLWRFGQYVQATRDPAHVRLAKFLLESGLADAWNGKDGLLEGLGSTLEP
jgi:hypothetical protein